MHPDRNYGNVAATTQKFADLQSAYEILSDPQERAWYDDHRESILSGNNLAAYDEHSATLTTTEEIYRLMTKFNRQTEYSDAKNGFYGAAKILFETIGNEEKTACVLLKIEVLEYPSFGLAASPYNEVVRPFYTLWSNFATNKSFAWKDLHRPYAAADRHVRRLMEKENKSNRHKCIREYNDAVRSLILFVRKRDPRVKANIKTEAERQRSLKNAASAQAARSRAANQATLSRQNMTSAWARHECPLADTNDESTEDEPGIIQQVFECVVCEKTFKSEKQYEAHERSKKHVKLRRQLERQVTREDEQLHLDAPLRTTTPDDRLSDTDSSHLALDPQHYDPLDRNADMNGSSSMEAKDLEIFWGARVCASALNSCGRQELNSPTDEIDTTFKDSMQVKSVKLANNDTHFNEGTKEFILKSEGTRSSDYAISEFSHSCRQRSKAGKAKEKRDKKAAQKQKLKEESTTEWVCNTCQTRFSSRSQLFGHVRMLQHAQSIPTRVACSEEGQ